MVRSGLGFCPFAEQIEGAIGKASFHLDNVGFCDHTAQGWYTTMQRASFWNDPNGNGNTNDAVSTHFAVARDGRILQVVNIFETAFAQGQLGPRVSWPHYDDMGNQNPNLYLISTEHEDYEFVNGQSRAVPGSQWSAAQYEADLRLKRWCVEECAKRGQDVMRYGIESLTGHHMFDAVSRAECPGRYWRNEYRERLFNDLTGRNAMPTDDEQIHALLSLAYFIQRGWDLNDLSPQDKAAIAAAVARIP